jgi:hypothetical protein
MWAIHVVAYSSKIETTSNETASAHGIHQQIPYHHSMYLSHPLSKSVIFDTFHRFLLTKFIEDGVSGSLASFLEVHTLAQSPPMFKARAGHRRRKSTASRCESCYQLRQTNRGIDI